MQWIWLRCSEKKILFIDVCRSKVVKFYQQSTEYFYIKALHKSMGLVDKLDFLLSLYQTDIKAKNGHFAKYTII